MTVPDFSKDISLELAKRAFYNISFDAERRGRLVINDYTRELEKIWCSIWVLCETDKQKQIFSEQFPLLRIRLGVKCHAYLSALASTTSSLVRNEIISTKSNRRMTEEAEKKYDEYTSYRKFIHKSLLESINADKVSTNVDEHVLLRLRELYSVFEIKKDSGEVFYMVHIHRKFKFSMYKQIEKIAEKYKGYFVKGEQSGFAFTSYDDRAMFLSDIRKRLL